jgi:cyclophilin family peptidyl-prolyl cis-trans isomerase
MKQSYIWVAIVGLVLVAVALYLRFSKKTVMNQQTPNPTPTAVADARPMPPAMMIDTDKKYIATLKTTAGDIVIELTAKETPKTVNNFVSLAKKGFYNGTPFHRVIPSFMIQGGDPRGNGTGGPGYTFPDEPFNGTYTRGTVAMANAGPDTNGSQFFIMHADYDLSPDYVIFGKVVEGMAAVDAIATAPTVQDGRENSRPVTPVTVTSVVIDER